jgi:hypothetical protein
MDNIKLPQVRRSRQDLEGMTADTAEFLPRKLSKAMQKREQKALEETHLRALILKASGVLEKLAADYRLSARHYELTRFVEEIEYYDHLLSLPRSKGAQNVVKQAVQQFTEDLYRFIWDLAVTMDERTQELVKRELYPEPEEDVLQGWVKSLGLWMNQGRP